MNDSSNTHRFALYLPEVTELLLKAQNNRLTFKNKELFNRIVHILRLRPGELVTLFDQKMHVCITLDPAMFKDRNEVIGLIIESKEHIPLTPQLTLAIGITKKEAFAEIVYLATQMGVTKVIPLITAKTQREWGGPKEEQKLLATMIAAAEQSKNFVFPHIAQPQPLQTFIQNSSNSSTCKAFFELNGKSFFDLLQTIHQKNYTEIVTVIGPEGGLTVPEQQQLVAACFEKYQLTPTVLRSVEAVAVALGGIRSST